MPRTPLSRALFPVGQNVGGLRLVVGVCAAALAASAAVGVAGARPTAALSQFLSADRSVWCVVAEGRAPTVYCATMKPVQSALLHRNGRTTTCLGTGCVQNWNTRARVLRRGQVNQLSGFRCVSATAGVRCTVSAPGKARGRGFRITRRGVTPITP
jgi:hypothetical protein